MTKCEKNNQQHLDSKEEEDFAMNRSSFVNEDVTTSNFQRQGHERGLGRKFYEQRTGI